jgi:hypothetical protein
MRRGILVFVLALAALTIVPVSASAVTFGANLNRPADNTATCLTAQSTYPFVTYDFNCSVQSIDPTTGEGTSPPAGEGIVTSFRVKVGPTTGPMQIAEEEALRKDNPADPGHPTYACCKLVALSPVFTPAPNSITTIPVSFRTKQSIAPEESGYYIDDHFSLSVLDKNVPIPAASDPNAGVGIWFPAWQTVGEERAGIYGTGGAMVLISGEWEAAAGAAPNGAGEGAPPGPVRLPLGVPALARVRNGRALLLLTCNLDRACRGLLRLQSRRVGGRARLVVRERSAGRRGKRRGKVVTYASVPFRIPAGKKRTLRAKLRAAGKRLLKRRRKAKVWLNVTLKGSSGAVPSRRITLKR